MQHCVLPRCLHNITPKLYYLYCKDLEFRMKVSQPIRSPCDFKINRYKGADFNSGIMNVLYYIIVIRICHPSNKGNNLESCSEIVNVNKFKTNSGINKIRYDFSSQL